MKYRCLKGEENIGTSSVCLLSYIRSCLLRSGFSHAFGKLFNIKSSFPCKMKIIVYRGLW